MEYFHVKQILKIEDLKKDVSNSNSFLVSFPLALSSC